MKTIYLKEGQSNPRSFTGIVIRPFGKTIWIRNGAQHRDGGLPSLECPEYKSWCIDGRYHRLDGPAIEEADGLCWYYLDGKYINEQDYWNDPRTGI